MRKHILAAVLFLSTVGPALAAPARPADPAPPPSASVDVRGEWCSHFTEWYLAQIPPTALPSDVRPDHLKEVEMNSCILDPKHYEAQITETLNHMSR